MRRDPGTLDGLLGSTEQRLDGCLGADRVLVARPAVRYVQHVVLEVQDSGERLRGAAVDAHHVATG